MVNPPKDMYHLLGMYYDQRTVTHKVVGDIRPSVFTERKVDLPLRLISEAQREFAGVRQNVDRSTPEFAQGLNEMVFGDDAVRAILVVKGDLIGKSVEIKNSRIPIDLGTNPWTLYQGREGYDTIDTRLTAEKTHDYLTMHAGELRGMGIQKLDVNESTFHYMRDRDLKEKFPNGDGGVDLKDLMRYLVDTQGYVGIEKVTKPNAEQYAEKAMTITSYRQKQSVLEKVVRELCEKDPYLNAGDVITDIGAHRTTFATEQEARNFAKQFVVADIKGSRVPMGRFDARILYVDDYYSNPKKSGFKSYNVAANVSTTRHFEDVVREIQIYDWGMHFKAQINEGDPAFHRTIREGQIKAGKKRREVMERFGYDDFLELMFRTEPLILDVPLIN